MQSEIKSNDGVSVVVCVYNVEPYIRKCLDSIINQTYKNIEIILVDDGSPDKCGLICDEYAQKDARIKVIHQENKGVATARNVGVSSATREYIGFVDPDDWIGEAMFETMVAKLKANDADIAICDYKTYQGNDEENSELHAQNIDPKWSAEKIRSEFLLDHFPNFLCNKIFKRELFKDLELPEGIRFEDMFISTTLYCRGQKMVHVPEGYYCYRIHASSFSTSQKMQRKYSLFRTWEDRESVCKEYKLEKEYVYSKMRAQTAAVGTLVIDRAAGFLNETEKAYVVDYLKASENAKADLSLKIKFEWFILNHCDWLTNLCGKISLYFDERKQRKMMKKA